MKCTSRDPGNLRRLWRALAAPGRRLLAGMVASMVASMALAGSALAGADKAALVYFPVGPIYAYRWKLLELALAHTQAPGEAPFRLVPHVEEATQNRGVLLLQSGAIDVVALGTNSRA